MFFSRLQIEVGVVDVENTTFPVNKKQDLAKPLEYFMEIWKEARISIQRYGLIRIFDQLF